MAEKKANTLENKAVRALLALAEADGWEAVTLDAVAAKAKIRPAELRRQFKTRLDLLAAYGRTLDERALQAAGSEGSVRDQLFDLMMERFDALNEDRAAVLAIFKGLKRNPKDAAKFLPNLARSMARILEGAETGAAPPCGTLRVLGLTAIYIDTLRCWAEDESGDMSPTMAALDKNLGRAERWAEMAGA